jgi:7-carboxy-7-deazaguanine synthase
VNAAPASTARGKLAVSELFESIQGEGASAGTPCLFLRLAHCNLRCSWCDTRYSWDFEQYNYAEEVENLETVAVAERVKTSGAARLVLTGGEPLIQRAEVETLLTLLSPELVIEVETNGTLSPGARLLARVDQWNVSPKLANSGDPAQKRLRLGPLRELVGSDRAYLKLVVATATDLAEAEALITACAWPRERVMLMPQAATRSELGARAPLVQAEALARGLRYSPRLHVERWNGERGR